MKFEIKHRLTGAVLFETEATTMRLAVEKAVAAQVSLAHANLAHANLFGANLARANLAHSDLTYASLTYADLTRADLAYADLTRADLTRANLAYANLTGANLACANLIDVKNDFIKKITKAKSEAAGLYRAILDGRIDGSCYEGECACFVGTIANVRGVYYKKLGDEIGIKANSSSPVERLFMAIKKGDSPENNPVSKIVSEWIVDWAKDNGVKLPTRRVVWELTKEKGLVTRNEYKTI